jgi:hypothetical protein
VKFKDEVQAYEFLAARGVLPEETPILSAGAMSDPQIVDHSGVTLSA